MFYCSAVMLSLMHWLWKYYSTEVVKINQFLHTLHHVQLVASRRERIVLSKSMFGLVQKQVLRVLLFCCTYKDFSWQGGWLSRICRWWTEDNPDLRLTGLQGRRFIRADPSGDQLPVSRGELPDRFPTITKLIFTFYSRSLHIFYHAR